MPTIEEFPDLCGETSTDASSPPSKQSIERMKRRTKTINRSREKRKQEFEVMRRLAYGLETQLKYLQHRRDKMLSRHTHDDSGKIATLAPVWEQIARNQIVARRRAEREQERLKAAIEAQFQVAEELIQKIKKAQAGFEEVPQLPEPERLEMTVCMQREHLNILCTQWFVAFSWHSCLNYRSLDFVDSKLASDDLLEVVFDTFSNWTLPYPAAVVEEALWEVVTEEYEDSESMYKPVENTNDLLLTNEESQALLSKNTTEGRLTGTSLCRRFRNCQGHLMLASNACSSFKYTRGWDDGYTSKEDIWLRMIDARDLPGAGSIPQPTTSLTILQHVRRSRIQRHSCREKNRSNAQMKTHLAFVESELRGVQLRVESALLRGQRTEKASTS